MSFANMMRIMPLLPWEVSREERARFRNLVLALLIITFLIGVAVPLLPVTKEDKRRIVKPPERVVKMVLEQKKKIPPPPKPKPKPKKEKKKPKLEEKQKPKAKPKPKESARTPRPNKRPTPRPASSARKRAEKSAAAFDALDDLRMDDVFEKMGNTANVTQGGSTATRAERNLIGQRANRGSGGIQTARASSASGTGQGLTSRGSSRVSSSISARGGGGDGVRRGGGGSGAGQRSDENIQLAFEKIKGALYSAYNRALRNNPSLQGKVVFYLEIAANGKVLVARIHSSDLKDPKLEKRLLSRVKKLNFGASNVGVWKGKYPIDFFPG